MLTQMQNYPRLESTDVRVVGKRKQDGIESQWCGTAPSVFLWKHFGPIPISS
ncbi:MAG TPA: hypothetical protein VFO91_01845 [Anaerolineales bacterium]|nr:hypothetical protein [Anaerolineales bacterium]